MKILAIDPGTKQIGVAVLDGEDLIFYAVKTVRDRSTAQKILKQAAVIIGELIVKFEPDCLAIEKMFIVQKSAALLSVVAEEIKFEARVFGLPIYEYAPTVVRKSVCGSGKATKQELAKVVSNRYPELARHLNARAKWEESYYANIYDAVGVALVCRAENTLQQLPLAGHPNQSPAATLS